MHEFLKKHVNCIAEKAEHFDDWEDWINSLDPQEKFVLDSGVIQTQLLSLKHEELDEPEKFLLQELSQEGELHQAPLCVDPKDTLFGPIAQRCLGRNRTQSAHLCSFQELALVAAALECLVFKSTSWRTCTKAETLLLKQGCPELVFLNKQVEKGERLLLCSPKEKPIFLLWTEDVGRLTNAQTLSLLPEADWSDFSGRLKETQDAARCASLNCRHPLPFTVELFKDLNQEKFYQLYFIWKKLSVQARVQASLLPTVTDARIAEKETGIPVGAYWISKTAVSYTWTGDWKGDR